MDKGSVYPLAGLYTPRSPTDGHVGQMGRVTVCLLEISSHLSCGLQTSSRVCCEWICATIGRIIADQNRDMVLTNFLKQYIAFHSCYFTYTFVKIVSTQLWITAPFGITLHCVCMFVPLDLGFFK